MTKRWTTENLPDLAGKTFVVTGATAGLGEVTTRELVRAGARVVMAVRNEKKAADVVRRIGPVSGQIDVRRLDVASLDSVNEFVQSWDGPVDVLINNAGVSLVPFELTSDGVELHMATNYFGAVALTNKLLPVITDRVVFVSSQLHRLSRLRLDDLTWTSRKYNEVAAYCDSKLADVVFANELNRRLVASGSRVRSLTAHPGIARTDLVSHSKSMFGRINMLGPLLNDVEHGALPTLYASTADVPGGSYVGPDGIASIKGNPKIRKSSRAAQNPTLGGDLWNKTNAILGTRFSPCL